VSQHTAAIDLGGTHVRAAVVRADGTILAAVRRGTPVDEPRPDFLADLVAEAVDHAHGATIECAVVGIPGIIDHERDALVHAPNIPAGWTAHLTGPALTNDLGVPVSLANDADLAAVGEASFGAGRDYRDVVYVTISTGVGAGIVVDRQLVRGTYSGGEIGHTVIDAVAARAGRPATVEELGAGPTIAADAAAAGLSERDAALAALVREGEPRATEVWNRAIESVGIGVVNLAWIITPEVVVIGGGVGNNSDIVVPVVRRLLDAHGPGVPGGIAVAGAALGDDAALAGAPGWFEAIGRGLPVGRRP